MRVSPSSPTTPSKSWCDVPPCLFVIRFKRPRQAGAASGKVGERPSAATAKSTDEETQQASVLHKRAWIESSVVAALAVGVEKIALAVAPGEGLGADLQTHPTNEVGA